MSVVSLSAFVLLGLFTLTTTLIKYNFARDQLPSLDARSLLTSTLNHEPESYFEVQGRDRGDKETFQTVIKDIIEYLRTDGKPGHPPSGGIGWIAFAVLFGILSPILIPLLLSPLVLLLVYIIYVAAVFQ